MEEFKATFNANEWMRAHYNQDTTPADHALSAASEKYGFNHGYQQGVKDNQEALAALHYHPAPLIARLDKVEAGASMHETKLNALLDFTDKLEAQVAEMKKGETDFAPMFTASVKYLHRLDDLERKVADLERTRINRPEPAKLMKANPACNIIPDWPHGNEQHHWRPNCDDEPACQPVEPAKEGRWMMRTRALGKDHVLHRESGDCELWECRPATAAEMFRSGARVKFTRPGDNFQFGTILPFNPGFTWPPNFVLVSFDGSLEPLPINWESLDLLAPAPEGNTGTTITMPLKGSMISTP